MVAKRTECRHICRHGVIREVTPDDLAQPFALFRDWLMHASSQFLPPTGRKGPSVFGENRPLGTLAAGLQSRTGMTEYQGLTEDRTRKPLSLCSLDRMRVPLFTAIFAAAVLAVSYAAERFDLAVYALSFWHYLVYALAFCLRSIDHNAFKRDAVLLKALSITLLVGVLFQTVPNHASLVVAAAGFGLNLWAATVLGMDRTYYGVEIRGMPVELSGALPFSIVRHPMLTGNMVAYGGLLLDSEFRQDWWPLVLLHVACNFLLLLMEVRGSIDRSRALPSVWIGLLAGTLLLIVCFAHVMLFVLMSAIIIIAFGAALIDNYAKPTDDRRV